MAPPEEPPAMRTRAAMHLRPPATLVLSGSDRLSRADVTPLCEQGRAVLERCGRVNVECDVGSVLVPDAVAVDVLARLQLTAKRLGVRVRLVRVSRELKELIAFMGLLEAVPCDELRVEAGRKPEEREPSCGVEEETDPGDLPV